MVQLSYPYVTAGKTIALTTQSFVGKVMQPKINNFKKRYIFLKDILNVKKITDN